MWRADVVSCGSEPSTVVWCSPVYTGFMWMLLLVAYGQKDPNAFLLKQHIRTSFDPAISQSMSLSDVFQWANTSLLSNLFGNYPGKKKTNLFFSFITVDHLPPSYSETNRLRLFSLTPSWNSLWSQRSSSWNVSCPVPFQFVRCSLTINSLSVLWCTLHQY